MTEISAEAATTASRPADVLMNLIAILLTPTFLCASNGNIDLARLAAIETVKAYRAQNDADLIVVAQIIAFGLAALGSLSLSMEDDLTLNMTLRLRGNANACNRSAEQNRRALQNSRVDQLISHAAPDEPHPQTDASLTHEALVTSVIEARRLAARVDSRPTPPMPQPTRTGATGMIDAASQINAALLDLPANQRGAASLRSATLTSTASSLLAGLGAASLKPAIRSGLPPAAA